MWTRLKNRIWFLRIENKIALREAIIRTMLYGGNMSYIGRDTDD